MKTFLALALAGSALVAAVPANAAPYLFTLTGPTATATFTIDSSPAGVFVSPKGFFAVNNVVGTYNGTAGVANIDFFDNSGTTGYTGGLEIDFPAGQNSIFARSGPLLYTGSPSAPTFSLGTFTLPGVDGNSKAATLVISAIAAVPEPATWGMMIFGFGLAGAALRRRSAVRTTVRYA